MLIFCKHESKFCAQLCPYCHIRTQVGQQPLKVSLTNRYLVYHLAQTPLSLKMQIMKLELWKLQHYNTLPHSEVQKGYDFSSVVVSQPMQTHSRSWPVHPLFIDWLSGVACGIAPYE